MLLRKFTVAMIIALALVQFSLLTTVFAERQTITTSGTYTMGDGETKRIATERAVREAENNALEQAGIYLERYSSTKNLQLNRDELKKVAGKIVERVGDPRLDYQVMGENSIKITATITVVVDTDNIKKVLKEEHESVKAENEELKSSYADNTDKMTKLQQELQISQNEGTIQKIRQKIVDNERDFIVLQNIDKANRLNVEKKYQEAITLLNETIAISSTHGSAYFARGVAYAMLKKYDLAASDFTKAIDYSPKDSNAYYNRSLMYTKLNSAEKALTDINNALKLAPGKAGFYLERAAVYKVQQKYNLALNDVQKALEINPHLADAYAIRGAIYGSMGDYDRKLKDCQQALMYDSENYLAFYNIAGYYYLKKDYLQAIEYYTRAIAVNPDSADAYYCRASSYKAIKRFSSMLNDYANVLNIDNNYYRVYNNRGNYYKSKRKYDLAIADFNRGIAIAPQEGMLYFCRGVAFQEIGQLENAIADYTTAINSHFDKPDISGKAYAYSNRGYIYARQGKKSLAKSDFINALQIDPKDELALDMLKEIK